MNPPQCPSPRIRLASIPLVEPTVTRTLGLIRKRGRALSPPAKRLYALIDEAPRLLDDEVFDPTRGRPIVTMAGSKKRAADPS